MLEVSSGDLDSGPHSQSASLRPPSHLPIPKRSSCFFLVLDFLHRGRFLVGRKRMLGGWEGGLKVFSQAMLLENKNVNCSANYLLSDNKVGILA